MAKGSLSARSRLIKEYKALRECDDSSPMTISGLQDYLESEEGISISVRTLSDDLNLLRTSGLIQKTPNAGTAKSERGFFGLASNDYFDLWEIKILLDSVSQIPYIPLDTIGTIKEKLLNLTKRDISKKAEKLISELPEDLYSKDDEFIETFKLSTKAILEGKIVEFRYSRLGPDKTYVEDRDYAQRVHPYAIKTLDDYFYLLGYYEQREKLVPFRLDRIKKMVMTDEDAIPPARLPIGDKTDDIRDYLVNNTSNFVHEKNEMLKIRWHSEKGHISILYDIMGVQNVSRGKGEDVYLIRTDNNPGLTANLLRLGSMLEILSPDNKPAKKRYLAELREMIRYYD